MNVIVIRKIIFKINNFLVKSVAEILMLFLQRDENYFLQYADPQETTNCLYL